MLADSTYHIISHTDIKSAVAILENVNAISCRHSAKNWLRGLDLNQRPSGYEPDELPGCSTPRVYYVDRDDEIKLKVHDGSAFHLRKIPANHPFRWVFKAFWNSSFTKLGSLA